MNKNKIKLKKNGAPIVFIGSTNAMPMMYAMDLKERGYNVIYIVDRPRKDGLNRPENHFQSISYPYPDWIIEVGLPSQMLVPYFRKYIFLYLKYKINKISKQAPQVYILNSMFVSLASLIDDAECSLIALSHGGDLDSWGDIEGSKDLSLTFCRHSFWKYFPRLLSIPLIRLAVRRQYAGFTSSDVVLYFPKKFNKKGDRVIDYLLKLGVKYVPRFDISFLPLKSVSRTYKNFSEKLVILSPVRFTFKKFTEGNDGYNKGNDEIIKGLGLFYKQNKNIEIHFFEKGLDTDEAKNLCKKYGIDEVVVWHQEMRLPDLLQLYVNSDICFDQVGEHWIGAVGAYALYLGKPLIANADPHVKSGLWPKENPVLQASNHEEVFEMLNLILDEKIRKKIHLESMVFAESYLGPSKVLDDIFDF